jgi:hypothetical protein
MEQGKRKKKRTDVRWKMEKRGKMSLEEVEE